MCIPEGNILHRIKASDEGRPGVEGLVALHTMFSRQPVRFHTSRLFSYEQSSIHHQSKEERFGNEYGKSEDCIEPMTFRDVTCCDWVKLYAKLERNNS